MYNLYKTLAGLSVLCGLCTFRGGEIEYKVFPSNGTGKHWTFAHYYCLRFKMKLAMPLYEEDNDRLLAYIRGLKQKGKIDKQDFWIGLEAREEAHTYRWLNGDQHGYDAWGLRENPNSDYPGCGCLRYDRNPKYTWDDEICWGNKFWVCQIQDWAPWSACSVPCGGGTTTRCEKDENYRLYEFDCEEKACNTEACPTPAPPELPEKQDYDYEEDEAGEAGIIAGVVIFGVMVLAGTIAGVVYYLRKKKESEKRTRQRAKPVSTSGSVSSVASSRSSMRSGTSAASSLSGRSASSRMSSSRGRGRGSRGRGR